MKKIVNLESHPNDSRIKIDSSGIIQTLSARMGTGGGNVPILLEGEDMLKPRRLMPIECERLQGFPDNWTELPKKESMTSEEIAFWNKVKKQQAKVEGKLFRPMLTEKSVLNWYNKMIISDSNRYKALGNTIAIPFWHHLFQNMKNYVPEQPKIGSLFDGIGGFPLAFEDVYGKGSAVWASEVAAFPIAVTEYHFNEVKDSDK